jgi:hypothetical protein
MKKILLIFLFVPTFIFGQDKKLEFGIMAGNNGQLDKTLNDFYFWEHETQFLDDSYVDETTNLKFSASARYCFSDELSARIKFGKAIRKDYYTKSDPNEYVDFKTDQSVFNVSPAICFSKRIGKMEIMTGIEIPLMRVSTFTFFSNYREMPDSVNVTLEAASTYAMTGGFIWGINNFIDVKYNIKSWLGLGAEIDYGLLFTKIGDKVNMHVDYTIPNSEIWTYIYDKNYKKTFFSTPEVSVGLYFYFLNNKTKKTDACFTPDGRAS